VQEGFKVLTDMSHLDLLLSTKPLALRDFLDFLGDLILFIFVLITSPHHFRWCERNAFNTCRKKKKAFTGPWRMVTFPQAFSFDLL